MKKLALSLALSGIILAGPAFAEDQDISHGMTIYGRLETAKNDCTVLMSKYIIALSQSDKYLPDQGTTLGSERADEKIYVQLGGEHCNAEENYNHIGLKFIGEADKFGGETLANVNTGSDAATGIGIQLTDIQNQILTPNVTISKFPRTKAGSDPATTTASFPLYFTLVKLKNQTATPGKVQTNLTVQIERI